MKTFILWGIGIVFLILSNFAPEHSVMGTMLTMTVICCVGAVITYDAKI